MQNSSQTGKQSKSTSPLDTHTNTEKKVALGRYGVTVGKEGILHWYQVAVSLPTAPT